MQEAQQWETENASVYISIGLGVRTYGMWQRIGSRCTGAAMYHRKARGWIEQGRVDINVERNLTPRSCTELGFPRRKRRQHMDRIIFWRAILLISSKVSDRYELKRSNVCLSPFSRQGEAETKALDWNLTFFPIWYSRLLGAFSIPGFQIGVSRQGLPCVCFLRPRPSHGPSYGSRAPVIPLEAIEATPFAFPCKFPCFLS